MKRAALGLVTTLVWIGSALAGDDANAPLRYRQGGTTVILRSSNKSIDLVVGDNVIGKAHSFNCKSVAGCVVLMNAAVQETNGSTRSDTICNLVDGIQGAPACTADPGGGDPSLNLARQQLKVGPGSHTIVTIIHAANPGYQALSWEEDYTIYERK